MSAFENRRIILLTSGGPDSATVAHLVKTEGPANVAALYLRSGHPADEGEIRSAKALSEDLGITLEVIDVSDVVDKLGGGALTRHAGGVLTDFGTAVMGSIAIAYAMRTGADFVCVGLHREDAQAGAQYSRSLLEGLTQVAASTYAMAPQLIAPLIDKTKPEVFALGLELGVDYSRTWSCTVAATVHCGMCAACTARRNAFDALGEIDPVSYADAVVETL